jgi:hypothetical protein
MSATKTKRALRAPKRPEKKIGPFPQGGRAATKRREKSLALFVLRPVA